MAIQKCNLHCIFSINISQLLSFSHFLAKFYPFFNGISQLSFRLCLSLHLGCGKRAVVICGVCNEKGSILGQRYRISESLPHQKKNVHSNWRSRVFFELTLLYSIFGFLAKGSVSLLIFMIRKCNFELESFKFIIRNVYEARV